MILLITLKLLLSQTTITSPVNAAPLDFSSQPTTTDAEPSYVPNPRGRGTFGLLLSSIITLLLCVYTSIHLNIAPDSYMFSITIPQFRIRKMPEDEPQTTNKNEFGIKRATVYKFYWLEARALCKELKKIDMGECNPQPEVSQTESSELLLDASKDPEEKLDVRNLLQPTIPASTDTKDWSDLKFPNLTLNARGFLRLAREKVLHPGILDDKTVTDRSKADSLAKLLVCAQAFWVVINIIAQKASGLPSTLIELNVVVHVVVNVVVYGFWWNKPLSVQSSIILNPGVDDNAEPKLPKEGQEDFEMLKLYYQILLSYKRDSPLAHHTHTELLDYDIPTLDQLDLKLKILISKGFSGANREDRLREKIANMTQLSGSCPKGLLTLPVELVIGESSHKTFLFASHGRSTSDVSFVDDNYIRLLAKISANYHETNGYQDSESYDSFPQVINFSYCGTYPSNVEDENGVLD
ncbi:hypothetical protein FPQ18DRAFT_378949 [Pyronema domesticum]|nr:hypothetical protein FPQ18DRAFT_378949 [Pyronema domesticum]